MDLVENQHYEQAQKAAIIRRENFLQLGLKTQQEIINILEIMSQQIQAGSPAKARKVFSRMMADHQDQIHSRRLDRGKVDWTGVYEQIFRSCFTVTDMAGPTLVANRVDLELTALRALMEMKQTGEIEVDEF